MRVLHVVRPATGGIRRHVLNLLDGFDPAQVTNSVAAPGSFIRDIQDSRHLYATIPLKIAPKLALFSDLRLARQLARVQPQFGEIVHAHGVRAAWIAALAHRHRPFPLIFTAHNQIDFDVPARLGISFIGRHCVKVLAVSQSVADSVAACGVPSSKIVVVPNGIDHSYFSPSPISRAQSRAEYALPESAFVVATAARFSPEKGLDTLLQAARQRGGMTFLIAGDGPLFTSLSHDLPPSVKLLGRLDDVRPLLAAADVFAVPSRREGQGIAALEAMAAGVPVVASRVGGLAEMLTDGETALLIPPDDPDALAATLSRLQSDARLRRNLAASAASLVRASYGLQTMLDTLTEIYKTLA
ncbi:MAG: glycosyltransferase family 4 protein [Janthinobacterium lividum]